MRRVAGVTRLLAKLGPDIALLLLFLATWLGLIVAYGASFVFNDGQIIIPALILVCLIVARLSYSRRDFARAMRRIVRDWGPFILLMWAFESLESYTGVIRHERTSGGTRGLLKCDGEFVERGKRVDGPGHRSLNAGTPRADRADKSAGAHVGTKTTSSRSLSRRGCRIPPGRTRAARSWGGSTCAI